MKNVFLAFILFLNIQYLYSKEIYIYNTNHNPSKMKERYTYQILKLAFDKTIKKYGEYELKASSKMNKKRAIYTAKINKIKNFIVNASVNQNLLNSDLTYASFPTYLGIIGYRVGFISPKTYKDKSKYNSLKKIKKLTIGQAEGWLDTKILRYNNFKVKTIANSNGLFSMVATNRIDLFLRGVPEIKKELKEYKNLKNLIYDKSFLIYYDLPKFFFTNKANIKLRNRIEEGLKIAYKDGSFKKIFNKFYEKNINFVKIKNRKLYKIKNPFLKGIDKSFEQYNYKLRNNKR